MTGGPHQPVRPEVVGAESVQRRCREYPGRVPRDCRRRPCAVLRDTPPLEPTVTEVTEAPEFAEPSVERPHIPPSGSERTCRSRPAPREARIRNVRHGTCIRHDASSRCSHSIGYCCGGSGSGTEGDQRCDCSDGYRRADCELVHCSHLHFLSVLHRLAGSR